MERFDFSEELQSQVERLSVHVTEMDDEQAVPGMNPQGYLLKPIDKDKLLKTIREVFDEKGNCAGFLPLI